MRAGARVIRTDGDGGKRQARRFSTWAAKVIATIKAVADTLMDRGVIITLRRKTKSEKVERFRMRDTAEFAELRRRARRWADDNVAALRDADPDDTGRATEPSGRQLAGADRRCGCRRRRLGVAGARGSREALGRQE